MCRINILRKEGLLSADQWISLKRATSKHHEAISSLFAGFFDYEQVDINGFMSIFKRTNPRFHSFGEIDCSPNDGVKTVPVAIRLPNQIIIEKVASMTETIGQRKYSSFRIMPRRLGAFMNDNGIILTSMPKAGTHFMLRILERATGRRGCRFKKTDDAASFDPRGALLYGHARCHQLSGIDPDKWRVIVMICDPRDVVLSMLDFLPKSKKLRHHETYALIAGLPRDEQLIALIDGIGGCAQITRHCSGWLEWAERGALIVRYEDVLGGYELDKISDHLGIERRLLRSKIIDCRKSDRGSEKQTQQRRSVAVAKRNERTRIGPFLSNGAKSFRLSWLRNESMIVRD